MTTDVEKKFFEAFDIPKRFYAPINIGDLDYQEKEVSSPTLRKLWNQVKWDLICNEDLAPETYAEFKKSNFWREEYPEITDRILLELIEIIIKRDFDILKLYKVDDSYHGQFDTNIEHYFANYQKDTLKDLILDICQHNYGIYYHQVRKLFGLKK